MAKAKKILFILIIAVFQVYAGLKSLLAREFLVSSASEISAVMSGAAPGDTLTMTDGVWTDEHIILQGNGSESLPILLRAGNPGSVILNGTSTLRIAGNYLEVDGLLFIEGYSASGAVVEFRNGGVHSRNSRLTNSAIVNYNPASINTDYKWVSLYGTNNRVDHCYFRGKNHSGTTLVVWLSAEPNYHLIDHNYFAYRPPLGFNGGETIRIGTSDWSMYDSYTVVEYNYFERCNGETEIISNKSVNNTFRYNTFFESEGTLTLRHGNFATVEGNFFLGNFRSNTGGVRVIGEDHLIINNYFKDLVGTGFRSALPIMNGVPNSPLNRYFQVKRANILFNTFVNCNSTFVLGAGADSERTLPPEDCVIANNLVLTAVQIIDQDDAPINLLWEGNIMYSGPLGITQPPGITITDPMLELAVDGLWRPQELSPALGTAAGAYPQVIDDMDGQVRPASKDIGADQVSTDSIVRRPLTPADVGPSWYPPADQGPNIIYVAAGTDSLQNAIALAEDGDIIELVSAGVYGNNSNIVIERDLTIRGAADLEQKPLIRQINPATSTRILFEIKEGGRLHLVNLDLDGQAATATPAKYLIRTDDQPMIANYALVVDSCNLHDVILGDEGNFFRAYAGTFADSIIFRNSLLFNCGKEGIRLKDESDGSGLYNVEYFEMTNCTVWKTRTAAVDIYAGDVVPFTPGPEILINHCTFDSCGFDNAGIITAREADATTIKNSIFSNGSGYSPSISLYGLTASISYCDTFHIGSVIINRDATIGAGMFGDNPMYLAPELRDFTLSPSSTLIGQGDDGLTLGDPRWYPVTTITSESRPNAEFDLAQNYPNPFNPVTTINYTLRQSGMIKLRIIAADGSLIETLVDRWQERGLYQVKWQPREVASGIYFYVLQSKSGEKIRKMIYLK